MIEDPENQEIDIIFEKLSYSIKIPDEDALEGSPFNKKTKDKYILEDLHGIFKSGRISAIMGGSGSGKTTLLNILTCKIKPNQGSKLQANNFEYDY